MDVRDRPRLELAVERSDKTISWDYLEYAH